jgi:hypothetical protein
VGRRLGARSPHGVDLAISANAKLLSYDRMKQRYDELGARDQFTAVTTMLASRGTTIEESLTSTIASLTMPGFLLQTAYPIPNSPRFTHA